MARRFRSRFVRPAPRTKMWIGAGVGLTALTASTVTLVGSLSAGALLLRPFTVLRTRMILGYFSDQVAASESPFGDYADLIVTDTAAAAGIASIPTPGGSTGDPEAAWFAFQSVMTRFEQSSGVAWQGAFGREYTIDDKAMRKVGPDDNIVSVFTQAAVAGATLFSSGRRLIQLH